MPEFDGKPEAQCRCILKCRNSNVRAKEFRFVVNVLQTVGCDEGKSAR